MIRTGDGRPGQRRTQAADDPRPVKELPLADGCSRYFTTPHFNGSPAILLRNPEPAQIDEKELQAAALHACAPAP